MKKLLVSSVSALALLTLAACGGEDEQAAEAPAETPVEQTEQAVEDAVTETEQAAEEAADATATAAEEAVAAVGDAANNAAETATEIAEGVTQAAQDAATAVAEGAQGAVESAGEALDNAASAVTDGTQGAAETAGNALNEVTQGAENALNELAQGAENAVAALTGTSALDATQWGSPDSDTAFVAFNAGNISGNGGCNTFTGSYELAQDGTLSVGPLATTQMACAEEVMTAEAEFLARVESASGFEINDDTLVLTDEAGNQVAALNRRAAN